VRLAAQGLRDMDDGAERVKDAAELRAQRRQAVRVHLLSAGTGAALTVVALMIR
jgi:hypothetical protein